MVIGEAGEAENTLDVKRTQLVKDAKSYFNVKFRCFLIYTFTSSNTS